MFKLNKLAVVTAALISSTAFAGVDGNDWYIGAGFGESILTPDYTDGTAVTEDNDLALQAFMGVDIYENFGIEASYADLGKLDAHEIGYSAASLQALVYWPANSSEFSVYAKLGATYLDIDNKNNAKIDDEEWSASGGLGVRWNMNENWFARAEYNVYNADIQAAFLNVGYAFGASEVVPVPVVVPPVVIAEPQLISLDDSSSVAIFDFDSAEINDPSRLNEVVTLLQASNGQIVVKAHSDSVGSEAYNQKLSEKRAQSAVNYFVSQGISSDRFVAQGMGELHPVASNTTKEGRAQNRRLDVEYTILKQQ